MQDDFAHLITNLGGTGSVAATLGVDPSTVSSWKARKSIPVGRWPALVREAEARGLDGVTLEALARLHTAEPRR